MLRSGIHMLGDSCVINRNDAVLRLNRRAVISYCGLVGYVDTSRLGLKIRNEFQPLTFESLLLQRFKRLLKK
jgi:hypothetical protein